jgi:hypothetical protein
MTAQLSKRHVATHEAAHAVAAVVHGLPFGHVTIVGNDDSNGRLKLKLGGRRMSEKRCAAYVLVALAGPAASKKLHPHSHPFAYAVGDWTEVQRIAGDLYFDEITARAYFKFKQVEAAQFVERFWPYVEAIAAALIERGALTSDEVKLTMQRAMLDHVTKQTMKAA